MGTTAMLQVLGAIAYGEQKAYDEAVAKAAAATDEAERLAWRKQAAEELRHHKGFVRRLEALGADPERAMRPFRQSLDRYHGASGGNDVEQAVWSYLGEGVADDLLRWLIRTSDEETAAFIATVLDDEVEHEARAAAHLRALLDANPAARRQAGRAARSMVLRMVRSGGIRSASVTRYGAFLSVGAPQELLLRLSRGYLRRLEAIGVDPLPFNPMGALRRAA
jgi:hypothetical protein